MSISHFLLSKKYHKSVFSRLQDETRESELVSFRKIGRELGLSLDTVSGFLVAGLQELRRSYRSEAVYKSQIVKEYLLAYKATETTKIFGEFRTGNSKIDLLLVNGVSKAFEIKTELDSPERLTTQLSDYQKFFEEIYLVVNYKQAEKYLKNTADNGVGLIIYDENGQLETGKQSSINYDLLDTRTMFGSLRKAEYSSIIIEHFGKLPIQNHTQFFKECVKLGELIPKQQLAQMVNERLKARKINKQSYLEIARIPADLHFLSASFDESQDELTKFSHLLNEKV